MLKYVNKTFDNMKVVIWCGGRGTRLNELTDIVPKPIIQIGGKPILWHLMKTYSHFGFKEFVLCLGYKGEMIKDYFLNYHLIANDFTKLLGSNSPQVHSEDTEEWKITFADTGLDTLTGERLLRVKKFVEDDAIFMATYGDGLANVDIKAMLEFHKKTGKIATITGGHPYSKWGMIETGPNNIVKSFRQKPVFTDYINIGFMVFNKEIFDYLKTGIEIEEVFIELVKQGQVAMFRHDGFFHAMDTYRDFLEFNQMWKSNNAPWKIW